MSNTVNNQAAFQKGNTTLNLVPFIDQHNYAHSFVADAVLPKGTPVELKANGKVGVPTGETAIVIGVVHVPSTEVDGRCTVVIAGKALVKGEASGAVSLGDEVFCDGLSTDGSRPTFATIASTGAVYTKAVALNDAADTEEVLTIIL